MVDMFKVIKARDKFVKAYCAGKGWDLLALTTEQLLEIRAQPEWISAGKSPEQPEPPQEDPPWLWFDGQPRTRGRFQYTNIGADADCRMFHVGKCFRITQGYPEGARVVASRYESGGHALGILVEHESFDECDVAQVPKMPVPTCIVWDPSEAEKSMAAKEAEAWWRRLQGVEVVDGFGVEPKTSTLADRLAESFPGFAGLTDDQKTVTLGGAIAARSGRPVEAAAEACLDENLLPFWVQGWNFGHGEIKFEEMTSLLTTKFPGWCDLKDVPGTAVMAGYVCARDGQSRDVGPGHGWRGDQEEYFVRGWDFWRNTHAPEAT